MHRTARLVLAFALAGLVAMAGDLTITFTSSAGKGTGSKEVQYWNAKFMRRNNEGTRTDTLVDYEKMITYTIDHKKKTVGFISMDDALAAMEKMGQSMPEGMAAMMGGLFGDPNQFSVDETGKETIVGRNCKKFQIKVAKLTMELSADPTLKPPVPAANYAKMMRAQAAMFASAGPMAKAFQRLYEEMGKIQGVALRTNMSGMMGMNASSVATEVKEGPLAATVFALPEGYAMEDQGKKMLKEMNKK